MKWPRTGHKQVPGRALMRRDIGLTAGASQARGTLGRRQSRLEFRSRSDPGRAWTCVGEARRSSSWAD